MSDLSPSSYLDAWLADPPACDLQACDADALLCALEPRLADAWEHGREAERVSLLALKQELLQLQEQQLAQQDQALARQPVFYDAAGRPIFQTLSLAVSFIAERLEARDAAGLAAHFANQRRPQFAASITAAFTRSVFTALLACHQQQDLRTRYQGRRFPPAETHFTLGGHMQELGCIHIEFMRQPPGWLLDAIWMCR